MLRTDSRSAYDRSWPLTDTENTVLPSELAAKSGFSHGDVIARFSQLAPAPGFSSDRGFFAASLDVTTATPAPVFKSPRFAQNDVFAAIARGEMTLAKGATDKDANTILQMTLYSLGYDLGSDWIDGSFGKRTYDALADFQNGRTAGATGILDAATLALLDQAAAAQTDRLKAASLSAATKAKRYRLVVDLAGLPTTLYVIERASGKPIARYAVSPGVTDHATPALSGRIRATKVRSWWVPPDSEWSKDMKPQPPGINNPMGLVKQQLIGNYYVHGVPKSEEKDLGQPASHGCIRMSATNILELSERYAGVGTGYEISFDVTASESLATRARDLGVLIRDVESGREYLAAYATGEMG